MQDGCRPPINCGERNKRNKTARTALTTVIPCSGAESLAAHALTSCRKSRAEKAATLCGRGKMLSILRRQNTLLEKELLEIRKEHQALTRTHKKCEKTIADKDARIAELLASKDSEKEQPHADENDDESQVSQIVRSSWISDPLQFMLCPALKQQQQIDIGPCWDNDAGASNQWTDLPPFIHTVPILNSLVPPMAFAASC